MSENVTFSKYGKSFQETLAQLILEDRPFSEQLQEVLDVNFFEYSYLQVFAKEIFLYKEKYNVHPTKDILISIINSSNKYSAIEAEQLRNYLSRIWKNEIDNEEYIKEISLDFCKKQKLKEAIIKSVDLINNSSYDEVKNIIDVALKLGTENNFGHSFKKDFELRYELKARNPISTGWQLIDNVSKSGLGEGELGVVIAPTGAGKSMVLAHLGSEAIKAGKSVVHYTLELSEARTGHRYDSCISEIKLQNLFALKEEVKEKCMNVPGSLIIKEYPTKTATTNTLRKNLEKIKNRNQKVDLILVDYADLLRPTKKFSEKRNELESIYEELRALAQEFKCPIWTASQTNRSGLNAEVITMEAISEAFNKCFVADFIFSISRTIKDKNANTGRLFLAKNRNGPDGIVYDIFMDTSNVKIKVLKESGLTDDSSNPLENAKKERKAMKEAYKAFRKESKEST